MKLAALVMVACVLGVVAHCVATPPPISLAPIGPRPTPVPATPQGVLIVYSALERVTPPFDEFRRRRSEYEVLSEEGKLLKRVSNLDDGEIPANVPLAPGRYTVIAWAKGFRRVTVPVVIKTDETTSVHLDGSELVGDARSLASEIVRLPGGAMVGWRAKQDGAN